MSYPFSFTLQAPQDINTDLDPFAVLRTDRVKDSLLQSIQSFGILQPLLVQSGKGGFRCLTGYNRLRAAKLLGLENVPCRVIPDNLPLSQRLLLLYFYKCGDGSTTVMEDACLLRFAQNLITEEKQLLSLLQQMGHKNSWHTFKEITSLLSLAEEAITAVHDGIISEKTGKKLLKLHKGEQRTLVSLIKKYRYGGSKQQKLVDQTIELSRRHCCSVTDIVNKWQERDVTDKNNIPQQGAGLLSYLQEMYTPNLLQAEEMFRQFIREMKLPKQMTVEHSPAFEQDSFTLKIVFSNKNQISEKLPQITSLFNI